MQVASFPFTAFMEDAHFRLVVQRTEVDGRGRGHRLLRQVLHIQIKIVTNAQSPRRRKSYATTMAEGKRRTSTYRTTTSGGRISPSRSSKETILIPHSHAQEFLRLPSEKDPQDHAECQAQLPPPRNSDFICHRAGRNGSGRGKTVLNPTPKGPRLCILFHLGRTSLILTLFPLGWVGILCGHNKSAKLTSKTLFNFTPAAR